MAVLTTPTIYSASHATITYSSNSFVGSCLHTVAQQYVIGLVQAREYWACTNIPFSLSPSNTAFCFGPSSFPSLRKLPIRIPASSGGHFPLNVYVFHIDIPLMLGLDFLRLHSLLVDYLRNRLECVPIKISLAIHTKQEYIYLEWLASEILFTKHELQRFHFHFMHPSAGQLFHSFIAPTRNVPQRPSDTFFKKSQMPARHAAPRNPHLTVQGFLTPR